MNTQLADRIYNHRTKDNFKEVYNSYINNNYRAASVLLYSTVISDYIYKLIELRDIYDDAKATKILEEIEESRRNNKNLSEWENQLIDLIKVRTDMLNPQTLETIQSIKNIRNASAHPSLDNDYLLLSPSRERILALMVDSCNQIFYNPPFFAKRITSTILEDNERLKYTFNSDDKLIEYKQYLKDKYFDKMSDEMTLEVFKELWKMVMTVEDPIAVENSWLNFQFLKLMTGENKNLIYDSLKNKSLKLSPIGTLSSHRSNSICLIVFYPELYKLLALDNQVTIDNIANSCHENLFLKTFLFDSKEEYIEYVKSLIPTCYDNNTYISEPLLSTWVSIFIDDFLNTGKIDLLNDFFIELYVQSFNYNCADIRFATYINPILKYMNEKQFDSLLRKSLHNSQITGRILYTTSAITILKTIRDRNLNVDISHNEFLVELNII